jgi:NodT family efflux transporter outer membrane factor (OMF) lipoprotein
MANYRSRGKISLAWLLSFLLTAGCIKVGPDFSPPAATVSANWLEAGDTRVKTEAAEYRQWWQAFNDAALDRLIQQAYRENLSLRVAGVRVLEARAQLGIAIGGWYPQTQQAFGSVEKIRLSGRSPQAAFNHNLIFAQDELGLRASWELDFWGKFRRAIEAADASLAATVADYDNSLVSLTGDVASYYIQLRTLEKRLHIARQSVATQKETLQIAEARFRHGTTTQRDVEQAKTILTNTEATIPALEIQRRQTQNALCILLGQPPGNPADLLKGTAEIPAPPPQVAVGIPADLLRRRPDIRAAEARAAAQCANIGVAKADLYSAFSLTGTFSFQASTVPTFNLADIWQYRSRKGCYGGGLALLFSFCYGFGTRVNALFQLFPGLGMGLVGVGQGYGRIGPQGQAAGLPLETVKVDEALNSPGGDSDTKAIPFPFLITLGLGLETV